jgi:hypothetical protein
MEVDPGVGIGVRREETLPWWCGVGRDQWGIGVDLCGERRSETLRKKKKRDPKPKTGGAAEALAFFPFLFFVSK